MKKANKAESEILDQRKIKQETVKHEPVQDWTPKNLYHQSKGSRKKSDDDQSFMGQTYSWDWIWLWSCSILVESINSPINWSIFIFNFISHHIIIISLSWSIQAWKEIASSLQTPFPNLMFNHGQFIPPNLGFYWTYIFNNVI
jgi:hypothetical protein